MLEHGLVASVQLRTLNAIFVMLVYGPALSELSFPPYVIYAMLVLGRYLGLEFKNIVSCVMLDCTHQVALQHVPIVTVVHGQHLLGRHLQLHACFALLEPGQA
jgi:hypothetical protein